MGIDRLGGTVYTPEEGSCTKGDWATLTFPGTIDSFPDPSRTAGETGVMMRRG
jgi:hypothetical protein